MFDAQPWDIAQLHRLIGDGKGTGNHRLRCNDSGHKGQQQQRNQGPGGRQPVERVIQGRRVADQQCTLTEVVEQQGWKDDQQPGALDRLESKVTHVGVQGFAAGDRKHHGTQNRNRDCAVVQQKAQPGQRVECVQNAWMVRDLYQAQQTQDEKPDDHHRAKHLADSGSTETLDGKQPGNQSDGDVNNVRL